jgi:thiol-disulfide isomerase/thioredoxin
MKTNYILLLIMFYALNLFAQDTVDSLYANKIIIDTDSDKPMLIGYTTREAFTDSSFSWWFDSEYKNYDVDIDALRPISEDTTLLKDVYITIVMGTWCSDSRREVPRFLKITDALNFSDENLSIYNVDRDMNTGDDEIDDLKIEFVPTFIFFKNDVEIGRIVEAPTESLEIDMVKILTGDTKPKIEEDLEKE